ncbi:MAG: hypothetical protein HY658_03140 [Actinobacteria bacterium]|nr:hypothetical protein [Actinomycetota bacterium]
MRICRACGASASTGVAWCPQCLGPVDPSLVPAPDLGPPSGPLPERPLPTAVRTHVSPEPSAVPRTSRWRGGPTTLGPLSRVLATAVALGLGVLVIGALGGTVNPLSVPFVGMYAFGAIRFLLVVWGRDRVG